MKSLDEIDIFKTLEYIRDTAPKYAQAKANRVYLEEFKKSKQAQLMAEVINEPVNAQTRHAHAHAEYIALLDGLKEAIEEEEKLKWRLISAQAMVSCWQTLSANERAERKVI